MKLIKNILLAIAVIIFMLFIIIQLIPSPIKNEFALKKEEIISKISDNNDKIDINDYKYLPEIIQKYVKNSGFVGKSKINVMEMKTKINGFKMGYNSGRQMDLIYNQISSTSETLRYAFMNGNMFFIPFNGFDTLENNESFMKGELANTIYLFKQTGEDLLKGSILTYLSEAFFMPNVLLNKNITFKEIDKLHIEVKIKYNSLTLKGLFTFNDKAEMLSFETDERPMTDFDGKVENHKWKAECLEYKVNKDGLKLPTKLMASWLIDNDWWRYIDGDVLEIKYH